jgi:hypothetical protein
MVDSHVDEASHRGNNNDDKDNLVAEQDCMVMSVSVPDVNNSILRLLRPMHLPITHLSCNHAPSIRKDLSQPPDVLSSEVQVLTERRVDSKSLGDALVDDYNALALSPAPKPIVAVQKRPRTARGSARSTPSFEDFFFPQGNKPVPDLTPSGWVKPILKPGFKKGKQSPQEHHRDVPRRSEGQQQRIKSQQADDVKKLDLENEWYLSHQHEPDWSTLETRQVVSKVMNLLQVTRETHATAQRAVSLARQGDILAMPSISEHALEKMPRDLAPDEDPQRMPGRSFVDDGNETGPATPRASSESEQHLINAEQLASRLASASLGPQVKDQHESKNVTQDNAAAETTLPSKKRDSTISDGIPQAPPVPPRPARRKLSSGKENIVNSSSSSPSSLSGESSKRSLRFGLDNAANSWRPSTTKATAGTSFRADNVFKTGGLQDLPSSLKMTPLALPGETVDAAIKRISTLTLPKRPTAEDLMKKELTKTKSPPKTKGQTRRAGDMPGKLPRAAIGAPPERDVRPVVPIDTDELASHHKGKHKASNPGLSASRPHDYPERFSLSPEQSSADDDSVSPSGRSVLKHRRSAAVTMGRDESIRCKSNQVPQHLDCMLILCERDILCQSPWSTGTALAANSRHDTRFIQ